MRFGIKNFKINTFTFLIVSIIFSIFFIGCGKPTVGFYGLNESTVENFEKTINDLKTPEGKTRFNANYEILDSEVPLSEMKNKLKKIDMLIAVDGLNVKNLNIKYPYTKKDDSTIINGIPLISEMTSSMQSVAGVITNGKDVSKLPLLIDHLELTIDRTVMRRTKNGVIMSWSQIEDFAENAKGVVGTPILFQGGNELFTLDLIGAFCEAISGKDAYYKTVKMIVDELEAAKKDGTTPNFINLAQTLAEKKGAPLYDGISYMNKLYHSGYFSTASFSYNDKTVFAYMSANAAAIIPQYLSSHRNAPLDALKRYESTYFVSNIAASERSFTAPIICALPLSKNKKARALAVELVSRSTQERLSRSTGLAPTLANCSTPDKEADDARFWVASTNAPLNGLSQDAFEYRSQARDLEKMLVNYVLK